MHNSKYVLQQNLLQPVETQHWDEVISYFRNNNSSWQYDRVTDQVYFMMHQKDFSTDQSCKTRWKTGGWYNYSQEI